MDNIVPEGFTSSHSRKSKKCQSHAIQAQLVKEHKLIDKGEIVCSREMGKDQERMRKCLEKLEHDKKKIYKEHEIHRGTPPISSMDERERAHSRSSSRPLSGYEVKVQSRSRRQLQEAGATSVDLKRTSSRRSTDQAKVSDHSHEHHYNGRQRSNSLSLPGPIRKLSISHKSATCAEIDNPLPVNQMPSIVLTEEDCKTSSILYLSPNAKQNVDPLNTKQGINNESSNKENSAPSNQEHPSRQGFREHNPSPRENIKKDSQPHKHDHHQDSKGARKKHDPHDHHQHGAHPHGASAKHVHIEHTGSHDNQGEREHRGHHIAHATHGHHERTMPHNPQHHGVRRVLQDHYDSQSGLMTNKDSKHDHDHQKHSPRESRRQSLPDHRRPSLGGQSRVIAQEDNLEEAQNLYELAIQSVAEAHKQTMPTGQGRRGSLPGEKRGSLPGERRGSLSTDRPSQLALPEHLPNLSMLDKSAMEDLQELLKEVRIYRDRKTSEEEHGYHSQSRMQRKRLEHIEGILEKLSRHSATKFDPKEMLSCGYLRLSKHNIAALEDMVREAGQNPGIHAHSDVTDYDIWADIKREKEEEEAAAASDVNRSSPTKKIKS
ncbi:uncharacterized protein LOC133205480 [Saccostrea echinata]|uniref:uncharacterized protein LOC133205480 n=1 Tax=Saccostrea echinata TaxID=191078 RepID=UPI002A82528A|nr:uncharacterized protein LOC133205480 [Saccostrea echinata]